MTPSIESIVADLDAGRVSAAAAINALRMREAQARAEQRIAIAAQFLPYTLPECEAPDSAVAEAFELADLLIGWARDHPATQ